MAGNTRQIQRLTIQDKYNGWQYKTNTTADNTRQIQRLTIHDKYNGWQYKTNTTTDNTRQIQRLKIQDSMLQVNGLVDNMLICVNRYAILDVVIPCD